jgi:phage-related protein
VLKLVGELKPVPVQHLKKLTSTDEIWACRIVFSGNTYRILCFFYKHNRLVLTHGFMKKTSKTPSEEIRKAEQLKADYIRRQAHA